MTPSQKLIDAAAEALYEADRRRLWPDDPPWADLLEVVKRTYRSRVTIPITVALKAAVEELKGWGDIYGNNAADAISSLIPQETQETQNDPR